MGAGGFILAGGRGQWIYFWVIVVGAGWRWNVGNLFGVVVGGIGFILVVGGWWWLYFVW